jgi:hypothetical protein
MERISLDDYCRRSGVDRVDVLKVDVEGFEAEVLKGARRLLELRPKMDIEIHMDELPRFGASASEVLRLIGVGSYDAFAMIRPDWESVVPLHEDAELPPSGVINVFLWPRCWRSRALMDVLDETTLAGVVALALALGVALADWRKGLLACVAIGFLQDPLRKLWPGEPIYLTALVGVVFAVVVLGAAHRGELLTINTTAEWRRVRWPVTAFCLVVVGQAGRTLLEHQSVKLAVLGLVGYLAPVAAAAVGYAFARSASMMKGFLGCYVVFSVAAASGVYLAFAGYDWPVLDQVGSGLILFAQGLQLDIYPGFMRSPEVAAWHAAMGVCVLVVLGSITKRRGGRLAAAALILLLLGASVLTGRRKVLIEIVLFLAAYWASLAYARAGARRVVGIATLAALIAWLALPQLLQPEDLGPRLDPYVRHSASGFAAAPDRFSSMGLASVGWAMDQYGLAGAGAGTGSQGSQHFVGEAELVGGAAEGGLGKVTAELGLPGLLAAAWMLTALVWALWRGRAEAQRLSPELAALRYGLLAFLAANAVGFVVASQVYGDLFVLLLLGWCVGFVLAIPRLATTGQPGTGLSQRGRPSARNGIGARRYR